jgi:hypothetical protein
MEKSSKVEKAIGVMKIRKSPIVLLAALPGGERSYIRG